MTYLLAVGGLAEERAIEMWPRRQHPRGDEIVLIYNINKNTMQRNWTRFVLAAPNFNCNTKAVSYPYRVDVL